MKILRYILIQILACLIITGYSIGQSTLSVANGGKMYISSGTSVQQQNLNIGSGSQLINWGDLTVNGVLANFAGSPGLILKANENAYGSLMHTTPMVPATVEQYLSSQKWHLVAPGLSNETIAPYLDIYFKKWHEQDGSWEYLTQPLSIEIYATTGYSAWASEALTGTTTVELNGNLLAGNIMATSLNYTSGSPGEGWNLLGNPYPSAVDWDGTWTTTNIGGWVLIYDNGTYKGWNPFLTGDDQSYNGKTDGLIAPKQGFWVKTIGANPALLFKQDARSHGDVAFYKEENVVLSYPSLHLFAEANGYTDEMAMLFLEDGTTGFDGLYELEKQYNVIEAPTIYSLPFSEVPTAINVLPKNWIEETELPIVPVGFELIEGTSCTLSATGLETFDANTTIFLEDLTEGVMHDLSNGDYTFISGNIENPDRFLLHFGNSLSVEENDMNPIQVYAFHDFVYIKTPVNTKGEAVIYDLMGREIMSFDIQQGLTRKHVFESGYYIVKVVSDAELTTQMVYIKH
jgi:hypothetical protein